MTQVFGTHKPFTAAAAVRTVGFETDLCLAASEHPGLPAPGSIISGTVVLSVALAGGQHLGISRRSSPIAASYSRTAGALGRVSLGTAFHLPAWFWNAMRSSAWSWCTWMIRATVA